ncbi:hypothetical protein NUSPORA_01001 [Nucleospora cyclopteri]
MINNETENKKPDELTDFIDKFVEKQLKTFDILDKTRNFYYIYEEELAKQQFYKE